MNGQPRNIWKDFANAKKDNKKENCKKELEEENHTKSRKNFEILKTITHTICRIKGTPTIN